MRAPMYSTDMGTGLTEFSSAPRASETRRLYIEAGAEERGYEVDARYAELPRVEMDYAGTYPGVRCQACHKDTSDHIWQVVARFRVLDCDNRRAALRG